jgi:hypothetical protein
MSWCDIDMKPVGHHGDAEVGEGGKIIETWEVADEHREGQQKGHGHGAVSKVSHFRGKSHRSEGSTTRCQ